MDILSYIIGKKSSGGSVEIESGTYIPTKEEYRGKISFSKEHNAKPTIVVIYDITEEMQTQTKSILYFTYVDNYKMFGKPIRDSSGNLVYAYLHTTYFNTSTSFYTENDRYFYHSSDEEDTSGNAQYPCYFIQNDCCYISVGASSVKARPDRTYKWVAVWV